MQKILGNLYSLREHPMGHREYLDGVQAQTDLMRERIHGRLRTAYH